MKIVSLNIWGGKLKKELFDFFKKYNEEVDIFCLQEVFDGGESERKAYSEENMKIFSDIKSLLPNHYGYFRASEGKEEGIAMLVKKDIEVKEEGEIFVYRWKNAMENDDSRTLGRNLQYISFIQQGVDYLISHVHGLWNGVDKLDSRDRIEQSEKIVDFINKRNEKNKILMGDFNLLPDTESVSIIEKNYKNLIKDFNITSTRSSYYTKPEKFADYCFVSPELEVKSFEVLDDVASDHLALKLEF
jgi:endonuclease/exonuclease/phosphatase family metal-dependent hydrolase